MVPANSRQSVVVTAFLVQIWTIALLKNFLQLSNDYIYRSKGKVLLLRLARSCPRSVGHVTDFIFTFSATEKKVVSQQEIQFWPHESYFLQFQVIITSLLRILYSCGIVQMLAFFKLHTGYKYCKEQPFSSSLGWAPVPLSMLNRYFIEEQSYWLTSEVLFTVSSFKRLKKITLKLFSPLGFHRLIDRSENGPRIVTPRTGSRAPTASAFAKSERISLSKKQSFSTLES